MQNKIFYYGVLVFLTSIASCAFSQEDTDDTDYSVEEYNDDETALDWDRVKPKEPTPPPPLTEEEKEKIRKEAEEKQKDDDNDDDNNEEDEGRYYWRND